MRDVLVWIAVLALLIVSAGAGERTAWSELGYAKEAPGADMITDRVQNAEDDDDDGGEDDDDGEEEEDDDDD